MLTITNKQMEVFSNYMMDSFIRRAEIHLKQKFPVSTRSITNEALRGIITEGIEKAAEYNIVEREDVLPFLEYMIYLGKTFDRQEPNNWAIEILTDDDIAGSDKIALLIFSKPLFPE